MKRNLMKVLFVSAFVLVCGYTVYTSQKEELKLSELTLRNAEALARGESGNYEFPDGYPYTTRCNVQISRFKRCKVEIIVCQAGGNGCNSKDCPVHKSLK